MSENKKRLKKPPDCPTCGAPLETVIPQTAGVAYYWNDDGIYEIDDAQESTTFVCGECGKPVGGWRADGERWGIIPETEE